MNLSRKKNKTGSFAENYLSKQNTRETLFDTPPEENLKFIVTIPAFNESGLIQSLDSLFKAREIQSGIEVLILVNWPFNSEEKIISFNQDIFKRTREWIRKHNTENKKFYIASRPGISKKNSGVGYARKTIMDEAVARFDFLQRPDGVILSLDADARVDDNYFQALESHFLQNPDTDACNIYFEHPLQGELQDTIYKAISQYELYLRYYLQSLRYAGHPNAFHTVGSCFGVKASVYCEQGGMNKRQAGEDFYFLQKIFDLGNFSECNTTRVIPSPRPSERVPFGTGKFITEYLKNQVDFKTYHPELFEILRTFLRIPDSLYHSVLKEDFSFLRELDPLLREYLLDQNIEDKLREILANSGSEKAFIKRFFRWFNMFTTLKFLNHARTKILDIPVDLAAYELLEKLNIEPGSRESGELLKLYREIER